MFKRVLWLLLASILSLSIASAEEINPATMSFEELSALKTKIDIEYNSRPEANGIVLGKGYYIIGKDILPGNYYAAMVYPLSNHDDTRLYFYSSIADFESEKGWNHDNAKSYNDYDLGDRPVMLSLTEGEVVVVSWGSMLLKASDFNPEDYFKYEAPEGTLVPRGEYIAGKNIPAGMYEAYPASINAGEYSINNGYRIPIRVFATPEVCSITLEEGDKLEVESTIVMKKIQKLNFD